MDLFGAGSVMKKLVIFMIGFWYIGIFLCGIITSIKKYEDSIILLFLWVAVPVAVSFVLTYCRGPMTIDRTMIFILPVYIIVVSKGITSIVQPIVQLTDELTSKVNIVNRINKELMISFIIIILFTSVSIIATTQGYERPKEDWAGTADYLTIHVKERELIVTSGSASHLSFYYKGDAEITSVPKNITSINIVNTASGNYTKIWFVSCPHSGVNDELLNWLNSNCILERKGSPGGGDYLEPEAIYSYSFD